MMINQQTQTAFRLWLALFFVALFVVGVSRNSSLAQEIKYEDRIGSNKDFDMCEDSRFKRITKLVSDGKITQQQGFNIWKRIQSDKQAVRKMLGEAVAADELTQDQADRLLPLLDAKMVYFDSQHGRFGMPKKLDDGQFKPGEITAMNRSAVYRRLLAANERGEVYDYDVASIMNQLYAGFDEGKASVEDIVEYRGALNPRIAQSGSQARVLQAAQMQRDRSKQKGYGLAPIKITDPVDWNKGLEEPIYSGPQPGEKVPSLTAVNMRAEAAGQEFDPVELAGDKFHLMFFVKKSRTFGRFLGHLRQQLQSIEENSKQPWAMSVIVCTDDANEALKSFTVLDQRYPDNLVVGLSKDGAAGPPAFGLDKNLTATVIVIKNGKVAHNFVHAGDAFYTQPHILGAIASVMEVNHDTLRKYIAGTAGDAAAKAYGRKMRSAGDSNATPRNGFRKKLGPLVVADRITRAEATEILEVSGDETALREKIEQMVQVEKLTRDEAQELLRDEQVDSGGNSRGKRDR